MIAVTKRNSANFDNVIMPSVTKCVMTFNGIGAVVEAAIVSISCVWTIVLLRCAPCAWDSPGDFICVCSRHRQDLNFRAVTLRRIHGAEANVVIGACNIRLSSAVIPHLRDIKPVKSVIDLTSRWITQQILMTKTYE